MSRWRALDTPMPLRRELHEAFILIANAAATVPSMTTGRRPVAISRRRARPRRGHSDVASTADRVLHELANGRLVHFPVNMRFWDGSVLRAGSVDEDRSVVVVDRRALANVMREPSEIGLARAWVDGSLTVDGAVEDVLSTRHEFAGTRLSIGDRVRLALAAVRVAGRGGGGRAPTPPGAGARSRSRSDRDPASLRRLERVLPARARPEHGLFVRVLHR
jgi:hypothetical protein